MSDDEWAESEATYERIDNRKLEHWKEPSWKKKKINKAVFLEDQNRSDRDKQLHNL